MSETFLDMGRARFPFFLRENNGVTLQLRRRCMCLRKWLCPDSGRSSFSQRVYIRKNDRVGINRSIFFRVSWIHINHFPPGIRGWSFFQSWRERLKWSSCFLQKNCWHAQTDDCLGEPLMTNLSFNSCCGGSPMIFEAIKVASVKKCQQNTLKPDSRMMEEIWTRSLGFWLLWCKCVWPLLPTWEWPSVCILDQGCLYLYIHPWKLIWNRKIIPIEEEFLIWTNNSRTLGEKDVENPRAGKKADWNPLIFPCQTSTFIMQAKLLWILFRKTQVQHHGTPFIHICVWYFM